jgi:hypothetical protein
MEEGRHDFGTRGEVEAKPPKHFDQANAHPHTTHSGRHMRQDKLPMLLLGWVGLCTR